MNIRLRTIIIFLIASVIGSIGLTVGVAVFAAHGAKMPTFLDGLNGMIGQTAGTLIAFAGMVWLENRDQREKNKENEASAKRKVDDAHLRVVNEVRDLVEHTQELLDNPLDDALAMLSVGAWSTASDLLMEAHKSSTDPMNYALNDFYSRVTLLQTADVERVQRIGRNPEVTGDATSITRIIRRDAVAVVMMGRHLLTMFAALNIVPTERALAGDLDNVMATAIDEAVTAHENV